MVLHGSITPRLRQRISSNKYYEREIRPFTPQIQDEVVNQSKTLLETEAGAFLNHNLIEQEKKFQEDLKALKEEQARALEERKCIHNIVLSAGLEPLTHVLSHTGDVVLQEALKTERDKLEKLLAKKEEEQRVLRQNEVDAMQRKIDNLEKLVQNSNGEYVNRQDFWRSSWKCLICKHKTRNGGLWTCPMCHFRQICVPH